MRHSISPAPAAPARWWSTCPRISSSEGPLYPRRADGPSQTYQPQTEPELAAIEQAIDMMAQAKRPLFYTGGGVINAGPEPARRCPSSSR